MCNKKGQNTAEYAILIALIIAGAIAMQTYVKRGFQGGVKFGVDKLQRPDMVAGTPTAQYEPYYLQTKSNSTQQGYTDSEETKVGGGINRTIGNRVSTSAQYQQINGTGNYTIGGDKGALPE